MHFSKSSRKEILGKKQLASIKEKKKALNDFYL